MTDALHKTEIEYALLASVLRDNAVLDRLGRLQPLHLADAEVRAHYEAALDLHREGRPINLVTLRGLTEGNPLGGATVAQRLAAVTFDGVTPTARDMEDALIDLSHRRELRALCEQVGSAVLNKATTPATLAEMLMRECDRLLADAQPAGRTYWSGTDSINETLRALDEDDGADLLPTGIADLDRMVGGLRRRESVYLAARPSMGKSTMAVTVATNVSKAGHGVLFVSLEIVDRLPKVTHSRRAAAPSLPALRCAPRLQPWRCDLTTERVVNSSTPIPVNSSAPFDSWRFLAVLIRSPPCARSA